MTETSAGARWVTVARLTELNPDSVQAVAPHVRMCSPECHLRRRGVGLHEFIEKTVQAQLQKRSAIDVYVRSRLAEFLVADHDRRAVVA